MKEITLIEKDRMGLLADVSEALGSARVNIQTIFVDVTRGKQAVIHVFVKPQAAKKAAATLRKKGFKVIGSNVLVLHMPDKPGELSKACRVLSENGINVTNAFSVSRSNGEALDAISTTDNEKAGKLLKDYL
jgi:hypothetical protein